MALINFSSFEMNEEEALQMSEFIFQRVITENVDKINPVHEGVKMLQQIPMASEIGLSGVAASTESCGRNSSEGGITFSEKQWQPIGIEDVFKFCVKDNDSAMALFKPYMTKIKNYRDQFEGFEGSDLGLFVAARIEESLNQAIFRAAWLGDTAIATATVGTPGLKSGISTGFFDYFDGILKQLAGVTAETLTFADTTKVTGPEAMAAIEAVWQSAPASVRADKNAVFYVSGAIFAGLQLALATAQTNFSLNYLENGVPTLNFLGHKVIDMSFVWDYNFVNYFEDGNSGVYNPRQILFTNPNNVPVGTIAKGDLTSLESWYDKESRTSKVAYGFNLDAKVLDESALSYGIEA